MTAITRIARLRDCGVFYEFRWPADLPDFGRYNLIYGWNWSGKTTLSRLFRAMEMRIAPTVGQVTFSVMGRDVSGDDFAQATLPVRVFNRDFMTESVFPVGGGEVPPIFVVGRVSVDKQKQIDRMKDDLTRALTKLQSERSKMQDAERAVDGYCINQATVIRETLRSAGSNPFNNYDKSDFRDRAHKMAADGDGKTHRLSDSDREKLLAQHRATPKPELQALTYQLPPLDEIAKSAAEILNTTVISKTIESLRDDIELSTWVHQGLGLHQHRDSERCLFCEQTLPKNRLTVLEGHFSTEYERFLGKVDVQMTQLKAASETAGSLELANRAELYEDLAEEYETAENNLRETLDSTTDCLDALVSALADKKGLAFEQLNLSVDVPDTDLGTVASVNEIIRKHNQACDDFETRTTDARQRLEAGFVADDVEEFLKLRDELQASEASLNKAGEETKRLNDEIARLEREIVGHLQPAEELNDDLRKYLGHDELRLDIKDTGYAITRNGVPAHALSEGETTAIALLYFLKSLRDHRFDLAKGVVVLDDPVSSLDANALYLAFGFIRERTQDAAQLFIFTHNFTLFRQVRNWFHHLKGQKRKDISERPARFYMLDCGFDGSRRRSSIQPLDPLLERYNSEYHYLFSRIYREAKPSMHGDLETSYVFPNMARRLLEAFLAFRQPQVSGELWKKLGEVNFDEAKKLRILRFVHTHSHGDAVGEPEHDPSLLSETRAVLNDLLDLIRSQDEAHFLAMEQLVAPPSDDEMNE